jgi:anthranilate synthase/aminodeoxychorismate synthase-like glutamine amidotransferase
MIALIDNYDSFAYNLVQYLGILGQEITVFRNDKVTVAEVADLEPAHIVISPGPCTPTEAGISNDIVGHFAGRVPMLGVCLGHQCIVQALGGRIVRADRLMHGKTSMIQHDGRTIFAGLENPFEAVRYHSLLAERESLPDCLEITAETTQGEIMGVRHKEHALEGVQFHPESVLTEPGMDLLRNFLELG